MSSPTRRAAISGHLCKNLRPQRRGIFRFYKAAGRRNTGRILRTTTQQNGGMHPSAAHCTLIVLSIILQVFIVKNVSCKLFYCAFGSCKPRRWPGNDFICAMAAGMQGQPRHPAFIKPAFIQYYAGFAMRQRHHRVVLPFYPDMTEYFPVTNSY